MSESNASDIMSQVVKVYDAIGSDFSRTRQKTYGNGKSTNWPVTDRYLAKLKTGQSVLDIGCGNGKLITGLPSGVTYLGTDFSETLIKEARKLHPEHEFHTGNVAEESHWKGLGKYDEIFAVALLHHIPTVEKQLFVLKQMKEHLNSHGFVYLTVWNLWQEKFLQYQMEDHFEIPFNKHWKRYCVAYDVASLSELADQAGLKVEEIFYADRAGNKTDMVSGENLVMVASNL